MSGHERLNLIVNIVTSGLSVILQITGWHLFGPVGVAIAAAGVTMSSVLTEALLARRRLGLDPTVMAAFSMGIRRLRLARAR